MAIWEEGSGPTTSWGQEAGMAGNANQENVATLATRATQAASDAEDSEDAAALSATAAAGSATAAAGSATLAGQHKTAAETAQGLAETAQGLSEGARDAALGYSNTASGHATTATTQAGIAATQASTATTQAGIATTQAGIATTKAGEAAGSASNAADSETNAGTSATNAGLSSADAQKLAVNPEDSQFILSDGATTGYSALHHKEKAIDAQASAEAARDTALGYRDAAAGHASTATTKASEAAGSASTATTEASTATTQAGIATTQAGIATTQAGIATDKASAAATSATSAAASYDNFDDRYLGSKANDPAVDNDGDALLTGALYFNSTTDVMKVYDGSAWVAAYASIAGITLDNVTTDGNTTTNAITVGGMTSTGPVILNADPSSNLGAATKQYVDTIAAAGVHYHDPVRVEQEGNLNATYDNGSSGVGATLTNSGTQEALVIDGVTLSAGDRVLIYEQTNQAHNGIYTVTDVGSGSTNWVLTRAADANSYAPSDPDSFGQGDAFYVQEGSLGAGETYVMTTEGPITFGTTNIHFSQISSAQVYSGSTGIDITGTTISSTATLADVTTKGNSTTNSITVGGIASTGSVTASNLNTSEWDTAHGWGNHASAGYAQENTVASFSLVEFANIETTSLTSEGQLGYDTNDSSAPASLGAVGGSNPAGWYYYSDGAVRRLWTDEHFGGTQVSNWQTAYGWGDHSAAGYYDSGDSPYFTNVSIVAANGNGLRLWNSSSYTVYMSSTADATWGGAVSGAVSSDYNMYFKMTGGTNRGFVFRNATSAVAQIDSVGNINYEGQLLARCDAGSTGETSNNWPIQVYQPTANADAMISFHVSGDYAFQFGLDGSTNKLSVGGWSLGSMYEIYHAGNPQTNITGSSLAADQRLASGNNVITGATTSYCSYQSSSGTKYARWYLEGDEDMRLTEGGSLICNGNVTAYSTTIASDARLKKDVETIENALDLTCSLRGVSFTWNENSNREGIKDYGLIAQEVQEHLPELVVETETLGSEHETHLTVDYPKLVGVLIEAVKELKAEIDELKGSK